MLARLLAFGLLLSAVSPAAVSSHTWRESRLSLIADDGTAEIEWISPLAFRVARQWSATPAKATRIIHDPVLVSLEDLPQIFRMRTRYLTLEISKSDLGIQVLHDNGLLSSLRLTHTAQGTQTVITPVDKIYGLKGGDSPTLDLHGRTLERASGLFYSSRGYGVFTPDVADFNFATGSILRRSANASEFMFYYGPLPKEVLEQHLIVTGQTEVTSAALALLPENNLPDDALKLPFPKLDSWDSLAALVRTLNHWSMSGIAYPALDLSSLKEPVRARALELAQVIPLLYTSRPDLPLPDLRARERLKPYLTTYLREAHDRGFPLIHALPLQFARDAGSDLQPDLFLLGDELLVAPVLNGESRRSLKLPRGIWTDLTTNQEYRGNQTINVDAPGLPMFARNGSLVPLSAGAKMELHYFPSLGAEFFLWEPEVDDNSQFHAAPAGEFTRVEIETKIGRLYEWVIHHAAVPNSVMEETAAYSRAASLQQLRPGMWWHDDARNDLHIQLRAEAGGDRIVDVKF
jgi:Glycosyl hydrolases family 31